MFTGYTDQTVDVFWGIRFNNDRAWFAEHKQEFQDAVMTPTKALAGELYDWFQQTVSRSAPKCPHFAHLPRRAAAVRPRAAQRPYLVLVPERDREPR